MLSLYAFTYTAQGRIANRRQSNASVLPFRGVVEVIGARGGKVSRRRVEQGGGKINAGPPTQTPSRSL